jgi:hypothetical protein
MNRGEQQRMVFGFILLLVLSVLSGLVALGEVREETSHGLMPLLSALSVLSGNFANWAFAYRGSNEGKSEKENASRDAVPPAGQPNQQ